jgi:hypothetical protein
MAATPFPLGRSFQTLAADFEPMANAESESSKADLASNCDNSGSPGRDNRMTPLPTTPHDINISA